MLPYDPENGRNLILAAFEHAASSGRASDRMSIAVLKNRILQLTERSFREEDFDVANMTQFVLKFSDIVELDKHTSPPQVVLRQKDSAAGFTSETAIRSDLWKAVLDYSSNRTYIWDIATSMAVVGEANGNDYTLPTIDRNTLQQWRREFVQSHQSAVGEAIRHRLEEWAEQILPDKHLGRLRGPWSAELKRRVHRHLDSWFSQHGLDAPADIVTERRKVKDGIREVNEERLRSAVERCIAAMSGNDLRNIMIPLEVVARLLAEET